MPNPQELIPHYLRKVTLCYNEIFNNKKGGDPNEKNRISLSVKNYHLSLTLSKSGV